MLGEKESGKVRQEKTTQNLVADKRRTLVCISRYKIEIFSFGGNFPMRQGLHTRQSQSAGAFVSVVTFTTEMRLKSND